MAKAASVRSRKARVLRVADEEDAMEAKTKGRRWQTGARKGQPQLIIAMVVTKRGTGGKIAVHGQGRPCQSSCGICGEEEVAREGKQQRQTRKHLLVTCLWPLGWRPLQP